MLPRERIQAALDFKPVDKIPLQIYAAPGGLYEHGQKLLDLIKSCGHDFGDFHDLALPPPPGPQDFDPDGSYHAVKTDDWGTTWEYRIFGVWGHPIRWPLNDLAHLPAYTPPLPPACQGPDFEKAKKAAEKHKKNFYLLEGGGSLFETLHSLRRFEDVLMDIMLDTPEINRMENMIAANALAGIRRSLALDADGITFGDDFGTQTAPLLSPAVWRKFFKPRYKNLFEPIVKTGKKIFFHSCGQITPFLEDFRELGVSAIWPQLPVFDLKELAKISKDLHLAVQLHPDRGDLMQRARPRDVRDHVHKLIEIFDTPFGGSWLYIEIDPGFPWANVEALFQTAMELRGN
jgi:hypothetical protein